MDEQLVFKKGRSDFEMIGKLRLSQNAFRIKQTSGSGWEYSRVVVGVDVGNNNVVFAELQGGHYPSGYSIRKHVGQAGNANIPDMSQALLIPWEERFDPEIIKIISPSEMIKVGMTQKANKVEVFPFLSEQDAVEYLNEWCNSNTIEDIQNCTVRITGDIQYNYYDGRVIPKKVIKSMVLSSVESKDFKAGFYQTIYSNMTMIDMEHRDKENNLLPIDVYVPEYVGKYNKQPIGKTYPLPFRLMFDLNNERVLNLTKKMKAQTSGYFKATVYGEFKESGDTITANIANMIEDPDIKKALAEGTIKMEDLEITAAKDTKRNTIMSVQMLPLLKRAVPGTDGEQGYKYVQDYVENAYTQNEIDGLVGEFFTKIKEAESGDTDNTFSEPKQSVLPKENIPFNVSEDAPLDVTNMSDEELMNILF